MYSALYNRVENGVELEEVCSFIDSNINGECLIQLEKVNETLVKRALKSMKSCKRDSIFDTVSDCFINGPDKLIMHLTNLVKLFLVHGFVPTSVLICTLSPLIKDNFGDMTASDNYRAIAGGCLLVKLIDIVILLIEGDKLSFSELQFAYQKNVSTTVCSWAATSVINYFNSRGTVVYGAAMDMSKAFDMVEWSRLFHTLLDRKVGCLFLRLMLFIYVNQSCEVKWNNFTSQKFTVNNGVILMFSM